jgi:peptidoglycan/xylan/chitin deacetylase (PgdA/CDA1 family)
MGHGHIVELVTHIELLPNGGLYTYFDEANSTLPSLLYNKPSMATQHKTTEILRNEVLIIICLCLTACMNRLTPTPTSPESSPTPIKGTLVSSTSFLTESAHTPLPTDPLVDTLTLSNSLTLTPVVLLTATSTPIKLVSSTFFLPEIAQMPPPTSPLVDTTILSNSLTLTPIVLLTATPTPTLTVAATHIPIIEYHYSEYNLGNQVMMTTDWFESQMGWLADNSFTTLSAADLIAYMNGGAFPQKSVILSFDLGTARKDNFINVIIPTLEKYKFTALFFLLVNDNVITDTCDNSDKFCWDDLRQWQQEGIASIESHGITHPDYATLTTAQMSWDAGQAFKIISTKLGTAPLGFAYPFDSIPSQAPKVIQSLGYQFAAGGYSHPDRSVEVMDTDRYSLPRVYPYSNMTIYPIIGGSKGKTFDQMVMSFIMGS